MLHKRLMVAVTVLILIAAVAWVSAAGASVDQKSVLSGQVAANGLAVPGASVREGDVLVFVNTITGPVPAVRATVDGKVREVLASPGDTVRTGQVLVRIEPVRR